MSDVGSVEREVKSWLESITGSSLSGSLESALKDGVVLCNLVNAIRPNTILTINKYNAAFRQMQNIDNFLKVVEKLGVSDQDRFKTEDLFYTNNFPKVLVTLISLSQICNSKFGTTPVLSSSGLEDLRSIQQEHKKAMEKHAKLIPGCQFLKLE